MKPLRVGKDINICTSRSRHYLRMGLWDSVDRTMLDFMAELQTARTREAVSRKFLLWPLPSLNTELLMSKGILLTV